MVVSDTMAMLDWITMAMLGILAGYGLHGLGYAHYYGKREAEAEPEAEADPAILYSTYGYGLGHYGYAGLGYHGYAGLGHYGYAGLGHYGYAGYYGKRSA